MAIEKRWAAVAPVAFTASGTNQGKASVTSTRGFRVKMDVVLIHPTLPSIELEVKRVAGRTTLYLGPKNTRINDFSVDLSAYDNQTSIYANEQARPSIPLQELERAAYEEEPVVAKRVMPVDEFGNPYHTDNPLPVQLSDGSINVGTVEANIEVQLTHRDNDPSLNKQHDSVRIGDGEDELAVRENGSINVNTINGLVPDPYDSIDLGYDVQGNLESAVYKNAGITIATLSLSYDTAGNLTRVEKS